LEKSAFPWANTCVNLFWEKTKETEMSPLPTAISACPPASII